MRLGAPLDPFRALPGPVPTHAEFTRTAPAEALPASGEDRESGWRFRSAPARQRACQFGQRRDGVVVADIVRDEGVDGKEQVALAGANCLCYCGTGWRADYLPRSLCRYPYRNGRCPRSANGDVREACAARRSSLRKIVKLDTKPTCLGSAVAKPATYSSVVATGQEQGRRAPREAACDTK